MKARILLTSALAIGVMSSCTDAPRVHERPLGSPPPTTNTRSQTNLLNTLNTPPAEATPRPPSEFDPNPGVMAPTTGTINKLIPSTPTAPTLSPAPTATDRALNAITPPPATSSIPPVNAVQPEPPKPKYPTARRSSTPGFLISPYDSKLLIDIKQADGAEYPSGTLLFDTNFPKSEKKLFRVP